MTFPTSATQVHHKNSLFRELSPPMSTHSWNRMEGRENRDYLWVSWEKCINHKASPIWKGSTNFVSMFSAPVYASFILLIFLKHMFSEKRVKLSTNTNLEAISFWLHKNWSELLSTVSLINLKETNTEVRMDVETERFPGRNPSTSKCWEMGYHNPILKNFQLWYQKWQNLQELQTMNKSPTFGFKHTALFMCFAV